MDSNTQSMISTALVLLGGVITTKYGVSPADWSSFSGALMTIGPAAVTAGGVIWKWFQHRPAALAKTASNIPGVVVQVDPLKAPAAVVAAANDDKIPDVKLKTAA